MLLAIPNLFNVERYSEQSSRQCGQYQKSSRCCGLARSRDFFLELASKTSPRV